MPLSSTMLSKNFFATDASFNSLMKRRIYHVLLISSKYDAFMLEDDGRIDEQIFNEYVALNLRYPPQFIQVSSEEEALQVMGEINVDLVITMLNKGGTQDTFSVAETIKSKYREIPIVVLTPFSRDVSVKLSKEDLSSIDYVFSWLGDTDILLAIIKLIEDRMNVEHDVEKVGVQTILLVEDSVRFYSSYLPTMYKLIFKQSVDFMTEGLNEHQQMLRMRGRPKILLATNYDDAIVLYEKYKKNMLGIISDISYKREGVRDKYAGIKLVDRVKQDDKYMPILLQSSDKEFADMAKKKRVGFIHKHSKTLSMELRDFIRAYFAFGDFVFKEPGTHHEITRASDLKSLQHKIFEIPDASLSYHIHRNHFSKWLRARALFPLAELFKSLAPEDFSDLDDVRRFIFDSIANFRLNKARGIIAEFRRDSFDEYMSFARIGQGSIGGKARGLAFLDSLIKRNGLLDKYDNVLMTIPRTVVLCTDVFDEFMEENELYEVALSNRSDQDILEHFISARLPFRIHEDLYTFITAVNGPIAVRSSSLLEDSHYQPFAGIYSTYMVPRIEDDERVMIEMLSNAIKSVYASAFYKDSKSYMAATSNVIDEEKMGIVLQEVCGSRHDDVFYPTFAGVARSINFYPIEPEQPEDGMASIAIGLGKYIVDGGQTLRFSPKYPKKLLQLSSTDMALRETQKHFYGLNLDPEAFTISTDDGINLKELKVNQADKQRVLRYVASTYDMQSHMLRPGTNIEGKPVVTFANILQYDTFPLAQILKDALEIGQREMSKPVEIEFAVNMDVPKGQPRIFNLLQIRPIVDNKESIDEDLTLVDPDNTVIYAKSALGNGIIKELYDIVYIKPESFNPAQNLHVAEEVGRINDEFIQQGCNYVLIGPGRWGSSDPWLGIPVKWPQISMARVIIESGLENYRIDPSQGTHFFQNLTSFRVGYFTINPYIGDGSYDLEYLNSLPAVFEDENIRHIRLEEPFVVKIDGKKNRGVVFKPGFGEVKPPELDDRPMN